jgi:hypothetical protein
MLAPHAARSLTLELLAENPTGQLAVLVEDVVTRAVQKRLVPNSGVHGASATTTLGPGGYDFVFDIVQQHLWQLLAQGLLVWGCNRQNSNYPFFRLTEYGRGAVADGNIAQPYDPDGFMKEFTHAVPEADPVVLDYLSEAVRAFNSGCHRSAAVMLGCASEKAILSLHDTFRKAIEADEARKKFEKDSNGISIHSKYQTLKGRLDQMVVNKALPREHRETVGSELPAGFELIRRCRNEAGHPEAGGKADQNTVFMNLRTFIEYARRVSELEKYFAANAATW